jgi:hypothetical protein
MQQFLVFIQHPTLGTASRTPTVEKNALCKGSARCARVKHISFLHKIKIGMYIKQGFM